MSKIFSEIFRFFLSPIIWSLKFIYWVYPKGNHIICGAWFMERASDNAYLFHLKSAHETIFISRVEGHLRPWGLKSIHLHLSSKLAVVSSGKGDINKYLFHGTYLNLWHGSPVKRILLDNDKVGSRALNIYRYKFQPWNSEFKSVYTTSLGEFWNPILSRSFGIPTSSILPFGYPRNISSSNLENKTSRIIYMPTWRDSGEFNIEQALGDLHELNEQLLTNDMDLYISSHPTLVSDFNFEHYTNIKRAPTTHNINDFLFSCDVLISDYSGAIIDFMTTGKRIILNLFDYHSYLSKSRGLNFSRDELEELFECVTNSEELRSVLFSNKYMPNYVSYRELYVGYQTQESVKMIDTWICSRN